MDKVKKNFWWKKRVEIQDYHIQNYHYLLSKWKQTYKYIRTVPWDFSCGNLEGYSLKWNVWVDNNVQDSYICIKDHGVHTQYELVFFFKSKEDAKLFDLLTSDPMAMKILGFK